MSSSRNRVGTTLYSRMQYITKKLRDTKITSYRRQALRSQHWCSIALHPNEIAHGPGEVLNELKKNEELPIQENQRLKNELEGMKSIWEIRVFQYTSYTNMYVHRDILIIYLKMAEVWSKRRVLPFIFIVKMYFWSILRRRFLILFIRMHRIYSFWKNLMIFIIILHQEHFLFLRWSIFEPLCNFYFFLQ